MRYVAARRLSERERYPTVPGKHVETVVLSAEGEGREQREMPLKLGAWIGSQPSRAIALPRERIEQMPKIGTKWSWVARISD
ncbi:hypothetical protein [Streptomyces sp. NPDC012825]|uniref:hypothetical protein n=1 Tax=Streptomyces sp. NPDC012825 TaxID=3364851 RepID=UPI0036834DA1